MANNIIQKIKFKARPNELYQMYMNPKKHAMLIGEQVSLEPEVGGKFSAFDILVYTRSRDFRIQNRRVFYGKTILERHTRTAQARTRTY